MLNGLNVKIIMFAKHNGCCVNVQFQSADSKYYLLFVHEKKLRGVLNNKNNNLKGILGKKKKT